MYMDSGPSQIQIICYLDAEFHSMAPESTSRSNLTSVFNRLDLG